MPRGAKPGERRGGRQKGSLNGRTIQKLSQTVESVKVTVERVLLEYGHIAFLDIGQAFDDSGALLPIHEMPEPVRRAIAGMEVGEIRVDGDGKGPLGELRKIKILEKTKALDSIARHLGMFTDKLEHSGAVSIGEIEVRLVKAINGRRAEETHN